MVRSDYCSTTKGLPVINFPVCPLPPARETRLWEPRKIFPFHEVSRPSRAQHIRAGIENDQESSSLIFLRFSGLPGVGGGVP